MGLKRNLSTAEIVEQLVVSCRLFTKDVGAITNVVFMVSLANQVKADADISSNFVKFAVMFFVGLVCSVFLFVFKLAVKSGSRQHKLDTHRFVEVSVFLRLSLSELGCSFE
jgi:hypothetical protein